MDERKEIFRLKKGDIYESPKNEIIYSSVDTLRRFYGCKCSVRFSYHGFIDLKIGIRRDGYSFKWIAEKRFSTAFVDDAELSFDLSSVENGTLELTFFALSDAVIYHWIPHAQKLAAKPEQSRILYDLTFPSLNLCCEEPLYMKFSEGMAYCSLEDHTVYLYDRSCVDFLTYFNSFSAMKWLKYTNVRNLGFYLDLRGRAEVSIVCQYDETRVVIDRYFIDASERGVYYLPVSGLRGKSLVGVLVKNIPSKDYEVLRNIDDVFVYSPREKFNGFNDFSEGNFSSPCVSENISPRKPGTIKNFSDASKRKGYDSSSFFSARSEDCVESENSETEEKTKGETVAESAVVEEYSNAGNGLFLKKANHPVSEGVHVESCFSEHVLAKRNFRKLTGAAKKKSDRNFLSDGMTSSWTEIYGGGWVTEDPETQNVELGIVISAENMETAVPDTVKKLSEGISENCYYSEHVRVAVVDVAGGLDSEDVSGAELIHNGCGLEEPSFRAIPWNYNVSDVVSGHTSCCYKSSDQLQHSSSGLDEENNVSFDYNKHSTETVVDSLLNSAKKGILEKKEGSAQQSDELKFAGESVKYYAPEWKPTHCLFMNDDVECEVTSIFRSLAFFRHMLFSDVALAGAMLSGKIRFFQQVNGEKFGNRSLKNAFDLRDPKTVYENEDEPDFPIYGNWWYYLVPLASVGSDSVFYLSRGDNEAFSDSCCMNNVSLNGVSCWKLEPETDREGSEDLNNGFHGNVKEMKAESKNKRKVIAELKKGEVYLLPKNELISCSVDTLRKVYGDSCCIRFTYHGNLNVKVGVSREGYSFKWIAEKMFCSSGYGEAEMILDISTVETGTLEITFFALSDAVICESVVLVNRSDLKLDQNKVLYDFLFPNLDLCSEEPLYCKFSDGFSYFSHEDKTVHLYDDSCVDFLTYFNSFSAMKWIKYTNVRNLSVYLDIRGNAEVSIIAQYGCERIVTDKYMISSPDRGIYILPVSSNHGSSVIGVTVRNIPRKVMQRSLTVADLCGSDKEEWHASNAVSCQESTVSENSVADNLNSVIKNFSEDSTHDVTKLETADASDVARVRREVDKGTVSGRGNSLRESAQNRKTAEIITKFEQSRTTTQIFGGGWISDDPETQSVRLGITITTFKREKDVKAAVSRLVRDISAHPKYADSIDIAVVDNGSTLTQEDVKGALLITNRNLGGTGGFTRGLIHYQETGLHTHCLFMDDDASCEAGAIFRSMSFQRHVIDHKVALSGAMLFENIKFMQWENGAWFDGGCHSIKRDFDLRDPVKLFENEEDVDLPIYGAWWFFFFPLDEAKKYSLPFFVRGDDIDFSYANDFRVVSLNGVSCWQQDFKTKENAMTAYLFLRSHIVHHMTIPSLKCSYKIMMRILWGHFKEYNNSYFYGTAACVNLAMKHVMKGPQFWEDNIVPVEVLKQIKELSSCEKPSPYTESELKALGLQLADVNIKTRILPVFIRRLSFFGHLLPDFMIRKTPKAMLPKWMTPRKERTYMRSQITVLDELNRTKTVLKRSPCMYFRNLLTFILLALKLKCVLPFLRRKYMKAQSVQRTREFWKKQFGTDEITDSNMESVGRK